MCLIRLQGMEKRMKKADVFGMRMSTSKRKTWRTALGCISN